jgi:transcriptional regulator with XRE-family HTH domain
LNVKKSYERELILIGQRIKEMRISKKMTQSSLASLCDVDIRTIQRIEKGEFNMSLKILFTISDTFNVSPETLLKLDESKN